MPFFVTKEGLIGTGPRVVEGVDWYDIARSLFVVKDHHDHPLGAFMYNLSKFRKY